MSGLIKIAAPGNLARLLSGAGKSFDKNIYRPIFNATRPAAGKVTRSGWDNYRKINPSVAPRLTALGLGGAGLYGVNQALPDMKGSFDGVLNSLGETFKPVGDAAKKVWDNKGTIAGSALPIAAFLATRGRSGGSRSLMPTLGASGGLGYAGRQLDNWNRTDIANQNAAEDSLIQRVIDRDKFYRRKKGFGAGGGAFVPNDTLDYVDNPMGRIR